jgi:hypothetical protein
MKKDHRIKLKKIVKGAKKEPYNSKPIHASDLCFDLNKAKKK